MGMREKLTPGEIRTALEKLPGWSEKSGKLHREYVFPDFVHALGFLAASAAMIEAMGHHPEWCNVYNRVTIDLVTHDAGGITGMDVALAEKMESIAKRLL